MSCFSSHSSLWWQLMLLSLTLICSCLCDDPTQLVAKHLSKNWQICRLRHTRAGISLLRHILAARLIGAGDSGDEWLSVVTRVWSTVMQILSWSVLTNCSFTSHTLALIIIIDCCEGEPRILNPHHKFQSMLTLVPLNIDYEWETNKHEIRLEACFISEIKFLKLSII